MKAIPQSCIQILVNAEVDLIRFLLTVAFLAIGLIVTLFHEYKSQIFAGTDDHSYEPF